MITTTLAHTRIAEYFKARKPQFIQFSNGSSKTFQATANTTLRAIKTRAQWHTWECGEHDQAEIGSVRLRIVPDDCVSLDDLFGDTFNPEVNDDMPRAKLEKQREEEIARVNRDGVWGVIGEYFDGSDWQHVDSCFGFIGDDWKNSGYDIDIMRATLDASQKLRDVAEFRAPYPETWKHPIGRLILGNRDAGEHGYKVSGFCCLLEFESELAPVYYVNIGPLYSQHCARCGRELIHGTSGVELFDGR